MKVVTAIEGKTQPVKQFWRRRYPVGGARHQDADLIVEIGRGLAIDLPDVVLFNVNPRESHNAEVLANIQALLEGSGAEPFEALIRPVVVTALRVASRSRRESHPQVDPELRAAQWSWVMTDLASSSGSID